jgi:hypothetical protein
MRRHHRRSAQHGEEGTGHAHAIIDSDKHTLRADLTADFVYARLEHNAAGEPDG